MHQLGRLLPIYLLDNGLGLSVRFQPVFFVWAMVPCPILLMLTYSLHYSCYHSPIQMYAAVTTIGLKVDVGPLPVFFIGLWFPTCQYLLMLTIVLHQIPIATVFPGPKCMLGRYHHCKGWWTLGLLFTERVPWVFYTYQSWFRSM
jgi:hypothetical protein